EVAAGENLDAGAGPRALPVHLGRLRMLVGMVEVAGDQGGIVGIGASAVVDDILAPAVENVAMRVGEAVGDVDIELLRPRLVAKNAGVDAALGRVGRSFNLGVVEDALLEIDGAARVEGEA